VMTHSEEKGWPVTVSPELLAEQFYRVPFDFLVTQRLGRSSGN
jgi:hypothetical protein